MSGTNLEQDLNPESLGPYPEIEHNELYQSVEHYEISEEGLWIEIPFCETPVPLVKEEIRLKRKDMNDFETLPYPSHYPGYGQYVTEDRLIWIVKDPTKDPMAGAKMMWLDKGKLVRIYLDSQHHIRVDWGKVPFSQDFPLE